MEVQPINLKTKFPEYAIEYEADTEKGRQDPWVFRIVCEHGHISPSGGSKLWACSVNPRIPGPSKNPPQPIFDGSKYTKALRELADGERFVLKQDGDDGVSVEFDVADFRFIRRILQPKLKG